jgi:pantoate--beta-alanine ligase
VEIIESVTALRAARVALTGSVGLVPTMGALHDGHLALARRAAAENNAVIATIFVNPTQFNNPNDLKAYPRDLQHDAEMLADVGVDLVFTPAPDVMYPPGYQTYVTVEQVTQGLEGEHRPGHFRGVATVVAKLFNLTQPTRAYFGQKDAQQVAVIRQMAADLDFPLEIIVCPTIREADGLAMSSRNRNLTPQQRQAAPVLYRALEAANTAYNAGEREPNILRAAIQTVLSEEPLANVDYVSVADAQTLRELHEEISAPTLISLAVNIGATRLIDNIVLGE